MTKPTQPTTEATAPKMLAFVLRVRGQGQRSVERTIVDLEDVRNNQTFRFIQLEHAFQHIRQTLSLANGTSREL